MPRQFKVTVNGREYDVSVLELTASQTAAPAPPSTPALSSAAVTATNAPATPAPAASAPGTRGAGPGDEVAGMGGVVVEVLVAVGQTVAVGDRLLVLEAMKMKTPVTATRAGQVSKILVAPGDAVEGGQPLVTIA